MTDCPHMPSDDQFCFCNCCEERHRQALHIAQLESLIRAARAQKTYWEMDAIHRMAEKGLPAFMSADRSG